MSGPVMQTAPEAGTTYGASLRGLARGGLAAIALFGGTAGLWATQTVWSGAVLAPGQFVVESNVQKVQHPTGGIVGELAVREGQRVEAGDLLIRLDDTLTRANLQIVVRQIEQFTARAARLEAERDRRDVMPVPQPPASAFAASEFAQAVAAEQALFEARRVAREGQKSQLVSRIAQWRNEVTGLRAQQDAVARQLQLIQPELAGVRNLFRANLVPITRLNALEREAAALDGQRGNLIAQVAQVENKISETELQILQIDTDLVSETMRDLRQIQAELAGLLERRTASEDQLRRVEIRAPSTGFIHQLAVHTVGGVVTPAEPLMLIVPTGERLQIEARVAPQDIDQLAAGQAARVRLHAFNQRTTPELDGAVTRIAADVSRDAQTGQIYYTVRVGLSPEELGKLGGQRIIAGMQADVFVHTGDRTPLDYLVKPLKDQFERAFRER